jgi:hypothetical protein
MDPTVSLTCKYQYKANSGSQVNEDLYPLLLPEGSWVKRDAVAGEIV